MSNFGNFLLEHSSKAVQTQLVSLQKVFLLILTIFPLFQLSFWIWRWKSRTLDWCCVEQALEPGPGLQHPDTDSTNPRCGLPAPKLELEKQDRGEETVSMCLAACQPACSLHSLRNWGIACLAATLHATSRY